MFVAKLDSNGNPVLGADGKPVMIEVPDEMVVGDRVIASKSKEVKTLQDQLTEQSRQREALAAKLDEEEKRRKEKELAALPQDQRTLHRLSDLEQQIARQQAEYARDTSNHQAQIRRLGLVAYRERALRDVHPEMHDLVNGDDETSIDNAVDRANATHRQITEKIRQEFAAATQQAQQAQLPPVPLVPQMPVAPNPAYVAPMYAQPGAPLGLPTPTNPQQVVEGDPTSVDLREFTTEQAVRSGRYGGEMREKILASVSRGQPYAGSPGSSARNLQPTRNLPMGVQQPMGLMTPQVVPPQYQQQVQYQQPVQYAQPVQYQQPQAPAQYQQQYVQPIQYQQPQAILQQMPQFAPQPSGPAQSVSRTHAGQNPIVNGDSVAATILNESQKFAAQRGINPQAAFQQRFQNTPHESGT